MRITEHKPKTPSAKIGFVVALAASALGLLLALTFSAPPASADTRIGGSSEFPTNSLSGSLTDAGALAVSAAEGGDIYLLDPNDNQRVNQFTPAGDFVRAFGWGIVPGAAEGSGTLTRGSTSITDAHTTSGSFSTGAGFGKLISGEGIQPETVITAVNPTEIKLSKPATISKTAADLTVATGPGNVPINERQALTVAATSGQFNLTFISPKPGTASLTTTDIPATATHLELQSALFATSPGSIA